MIENLQENEVNKALQPVKELGNQSATHEKGVKTPKGNLKYQRDKDREPVKGIFRFYEVPGGRMEFVFKAYKEDPVEKFDFYDGHAYTIPLGVAKHLNKNGAYPIHSYMMDENGNHTMRVAHKVRRFGFQSLEFIDIEDLDSASAIVTVESTGIL